MLECEACILNRDIYLPGDLATSPFGFAQLDIDRRDVCAIVGISKKEVRKLERG
jgi:hypothetical protein